MVVCAKCRNEPRRPRQRWCAACHRTYMRDYMRTLRDSIIASEEARASAENWKRVRTKTPVIPKGTLTILPEKPNT